MQVNYMTEDPASQYAKETAACSTLIALRTCLRDWKEVAPDAYAKAMEMTEAEFSTFRVGLLSERKKKFAGEEWADKYLAILLPERMLETSMLANDMKVPWGLAYRRLKESGAWKASASSQEHD